MYGETLPAYTSNDLMRDNSFSRVTLYVPSQLYDEYSSTIPWSNFTNIEKLPTVIYLTDGEEYTNTSQLDDINLEYTRTFNNTAWQALYVPFSMTYDDWKDDFDIAYINGIRMMDTNNDNVADETIMDVFKIEEGSLIANTPYLIRAKSTGEKTIALNGTTLYAAGANSIDCSTTIAKYTFTGTYSTILASTMEENGYYAMGGGSLIRTDGESNLKSFRWYLGIEARSPIYNVSSGAKAITIRVAGEEDEATGIRQLQITSEEVPVYDLNGIRVNENNLKPGLYIKNGKKVVIK